MKSQQPQSYDKEKRKKMDRRYNFSSLSRYRQEEYQRQETEQQCPLQSPMPIKLVNYKPRSLTFPEQQDSENTQHNVLSKLKQENVYLPKIYQRGEKLKSLNRSYEPSTHKLVKKRLKTQSMQPDDSEYTVIEICRINDRYVKGRKQSHKIKQRRLGGKQNNKHRSRQQEFEQYVQQLQKKYNGKHSQVTMSQEVEILQKLKNRVETRKYTYSKPLNPELKSDQKQSKENSLPHSQVGQANQKEMQEMQESRQKAEKQEAEAAKMRKRSEMNDDFITILRKAKNRGASLLIKLKKFPSKRLLVK